MHVLKCFALIMFPVLYGVTALMTDHLLIMVIHKLIAVILLCVIVIGIFLPRKTVRE